MRADKVLQAIIDKCGMTRIKAARKTGRSRDYFSAMFARGTVPKLDTMADICDHLGWDLIARDRSDGFEITIDPPVK